jgi:hypothetical protein
MSMPAVWAIDEVIFSMSHACHQGSSPGIRSGHKEKKGAIHLSRGPSNGQHRRDPSLA